MADPTSYAQLLEHSKQLNYLLELPELEEDAVTYTFELVPVVNTPEYDEFLEDDLVIFKFNIGGTKVNSSSEILKRWEKN